MNKKDSSQNEAEEYCCYCGATTNLEYGPDPYNADIHGDITPVYLCAECREERARET